MRREEKAEVVSALRERFGRAQMALVASPQGLTVAQVTRLRRTLREVGGEFKVAKNTLARLAVQDTSFSRLQELLDGANGVVFSYRDPVVVAKALVKFAEENAKFTIRGGVFEGSVLGPQAVADLAKLPSKEVLLAQLLGLLQAPAAQLLRTIQEPGARMVRLIEQLRAGRAETDS